MDTFPSPAGVPWCSGRCRNIAALTRRGAREPAVQVRMFDVPKAAKPRPARTPTREEKDESAISRIARSSRLSRDLLVRLQNRRQRGELASEVWDDITAMLDQFVPGYSPRLVRPAPRPPAASRPAAASTLSELTQALRRLSAGLESGRIYDRDFATLGPALERLGNAWVRRTVAVGTLPAGVLGAARSCRTCRCADSHRPLRCLGRHADSAAHNAS